MGSNLEKLEYIKKVQREYLKIFGEKLVVEFNATFGIKPRWVLFNKEDCINKVNELCEKYSIDFEEFKKSKRVGCKAKPVMLQYVKHCIDNTYNLAHCAEIVNKDRTMMTYYKKRIN